MPTAAVRTETLLARAAEVTNISETWLMALARCHRARAEWLRYAPADPGREKGLPTA